MPEINNNQDIIDSREVIERINELEAEREELAEALSDAEVGPEAQAANEALQAWDDSDEAEELKNLKSLADEAEGYAADWRYGEALIRDSYFEDYAQQLAEDIGAIDRHASWPGTCIDWKEAAEQLQQDYTAVDFDGETYWIR